MRTINCERCGRESKVGHEVLQLHKCPQCENVRFDREIFIPIEKQVIKNFRKALTSRCGLVLKSLYVFGSYARKEPKCGDIDFLVTYSEPKLMEFVRSEIENFHSQFDYFFSEEYSIIDWKSVLKKSFWDFRTCPDYPDCLICYMESSCRLPSEDYESDIHTYCLERCRNKNRNPIPSCCFVDCPFLKKSIRNQILERIDDILKEGDLEFRNASGLKIKVLDLVIKRRVKDLEEEFRHRENGETSKLYKIYPVKERKTMVE